MKIGQKAVVVVDIPTTDGMIYKDTKVKISNIENDKVRVTDDLGKIWYVHPSNILIIK